MTWAWWTSRSMVATTSSPRVSPHRPMASFEVTITLCPTRITAGQRPNPELAPYREAAEALRGRQHPDSCQLGAISRPIKVADSWGDSAWGCTLHAEEALMNVPPVLVATESATGLAAYLKRPPTPPL
jgi:hypothetical protein